MSCLILLSQSYAVFATYDILQSAREKNNSYATWLQPYFNGSKQRDTGALSGYRANTYGLLFGGDKENDKFKLGIGGGYAYTLQTSLQTSETRTYIRNYLIILYGTLKYADELDLDWSISGGQNYYTAYRVAQSSPTNIIATAKYIGQQYAAQTILSKRYHRKNVDFIPQINSNLIYAKLPAYTEDGAGSLNKNVAESNSGLFTLGTGIQIEWPDTMQNGVPEIHVLAYYDLNMGMLKSLTGIIGGTPALNTTATPGKATGQLGASFDYKPNKHISIKADYDLQIKNKYYNNIVFINFKYIF